MHTTRRAAIALAASAAVSLVAACSGGSQGALGRDQGAGTSGTVNITWSTWGSPEELKRFEQFTAEFAKRHPNIKVELQAVPSYGDYHPKLLTQLTSNTAPDVFYVGDDNIGKFVASGRLLDLGPDLSGPASKSPLSDFNDKMLAAAQKDGKTYGLPTDCNPEVLWYDKQALRAAGISEDPAALERDGKWTIDTFLGMVDKLKAAKKKGAVFYNWWGDTYSWVSAYGGKVYDGDKLVLGTDPGALEAMRMQAQRYRDGSFVVADNLPDPGSDAAFVKHEIGFYGEGRYTIATAKESGAPQDYDIVGFPTTTGEPAPTAIAQAFMSVNKDSKHPKEAFTFLTEFVSKQGQQVRLGNAGNAVPSVKGADDIVLKDGYPANAQAFLTIRDQGFGVLPQEAARPGLTTDLQDLTMQLWTAKVSIDDLPAKVAEIAKKNGA
jgi:multiple sugar transport system substrate-binding protein